MVGIDHLSCIRQNGTADFTDRSIRAESDYREILAGKEAAADTDRVKTGESAISRTADAPQTIGIENLTEERINHLKSRYDIEDMSEDEYTAFMRELIDMGVMSKEDCRRLHICKCPPAGAECGVPESESSRWIPEVTLFCGYNRNQALHTRLGLRNCADMLQRIDSPYNLWTYDQKMEMRNDALERKAIFERMETICERLKR